MGEEETTKKLYLSVFFIFTFTKFEVKLLNSYCKMFTNKPETEKVILQTEFLKKKHQKSILFARYGKCNYSVITLSNHVAMADSPTTGVRENVRTVIVNVRRRNKTIFRRLCSGFYLFFLVGT